MKLSRRFAFTVLSGLAIALAISTHTLGQTPQKIVRIGITPFQDTVLPVVADRLGWYKESGYQVQFVDVGWTEVSLGLASGSFDVVLYPFDSTQASWPALKSAGKELVFYAPLYAFNGAAIMVRGNANYQTLASLGGMTQAEVAQRTREVVRQLKGRKVGITEGTIAEKVVRDALTKAEMPISDVELVNARYEDNLAAFLAGRLDAFVGGVTERVRARQAGAVELLVGAAVSEPGIVGWVTTTSYAEKNPEVMQSLIDNFFRIVLHMTEDPKGRAALATDYLKGKASVEYTPDEYAYALSFQYFPRTREEAVKAFLNQDSPYYWKANWEHHSDFLVKTGKIKEPVPLSVFQGDKTLSTR